MSKVQEIQKQIAECESTLATLESVRADAQQRAAKLEEQRRVYLVGALTGNAEAQANLTRLNAELEVAARDESDAADAIYQVSDKMAALRIDLMTAEKRAKCEQLISRLNSRSKCDGEKKVFKLANELCEAIVAVESNNDELTAEMAQVLPRPSGMHFAEQFHSADNRIPFFLRQTVIDLIRFVGSDVAGSAPEVQSSFVSEIRQRSVFIRDRVERELAAPVTQPVADVTEKAVAAPVNVGAPPKMERKLLYSGKAVSFYDRPE